MGTDVVVIEKQGIIDELTVYADKYGVALVNSRGYLTEYAHDLMSASGTVWRKCDHYDRLRFIWINLASKCPPGTHYITMNDKHLNTLT